MKDKVYLIRISPNKSIQIHQKGCRERLLILTSKTSTLDQEEPLTATAMLTDGTVHLVDREESSLRLDKVAFSEEVQLDRHSG